MSSGPRKKSSMFSQVFFNNKFKWARIVVVALLFTIKSLSQMGSQSVMVLEQFEANTIDLGVKDQCSNNFNSPISSMWDAYGGRILDASYSEEHASNANLTNWIHKLFHSEYQTHKMRSSLLHQADSLVILRLIQIIHQRIVFLEEGKPLTPTSPPPQPLHIMVMGGSVTAGMGCGENPIGMAAPGWMRLQTDCAWPSRLENLFNKVLFDGKEVVRVTNLAVGGASTEVGRTVLEYRLFTEEMKKSMPHVVIWAHAANDSQEADKDAVEYIHLPGFVEAARKLRLCDNDLPLVVMLEEFYGAGEYSSVNDISSMLHKVSSWYGLMAVSHSSIVKHKLYANYDNDVVKDMTGGKWNLHPGMGAHIGVAWTVFFNFLKAFIDSCEDGPVLRYGMVSHNNSNGDPHKMHLSGYKKDETVKSLQARWQKEADTKKELCSSKNQTQDSEVCTYAWMVNRMTGISHPQHVNAVLKGVMVSNDGWEASGNPVRQPRTGWYAQKANAKFSFKIHPTLNTRYITLMTMKSYGEKFKNTMLKLSVRIQSESEPVHEDSYNISGYHDTKTSIHIPHKFHLPQGGAGPGDTIFVDVELISGAVFKINGIALCAY